MVELDRTAGLATDDLHQQFEASLKLGGFLSGDADDADGIAFALYGAFGVAVNGVIAVCVFTGGLIGAVGPCAVAVVSSFAAGRECEDSGDCSDAELAEQILAQGFSLSGHRGCSPQCGALDTVRILARLCRTRHHSTEAV